MQTFENFLRSTEFYDIAHIVIKVCSNGGAAYIIGKIIAKYNLNKENLMPTFENLLLQNCSTKFLDVTYK